MKLFTRIVVHLLFVLGLLVFIVMPTHEYAWMQEMDPSIATLPADDGAGNRNVLTFLLLIGMVATQLGLAITSENKKERVASIVLAGVAICVWLSRFWQ